MRTTIRLTESELHSLVMEAASNVIDFIGNPSVEDTEYINFDAFVQNQPDSGDYRIYNDPKFKNFCKRMKLKHGDIVNPRWQDIYLRLCSAGIL